MDDHVYKLIELVGTSASSVEEAVNNAVHRAGETIKNLRWFQIGEIRGEIKENNVTHWQVTFKAGFTVEKTRLP